MYNSFSRLSSAPQRADCTDALRGVTQPHTKASCAIRRGQAAQFLGQSVRSHYVLTDLRCIASPSNRGASRSGVHAACAGIGARLPCHVLPARAAAARRLRTSATAAAGKAAVDDALAAGMIVEFNKDGRFILAAVLQPDGKKNWWVADFKGQRYSMQPKQVRGLRSSAHDAYKRTPRAPNRK